MSQNTCQEVLSQMRRRSLRSGRPYKSQRVPELVELFGYHRAAVLRALRAQPVRARFPFSGIGLGNTRQKNFCPRSSYLAGGACGVVGSPPF